MKVIFSNKNNNYYYLYHYQVLKIKYDDTRHQP